MMNPKDKETQDGGDCIKAAMAGPSSSSSSRQWSMFKNPRIVRVSRTFGGKDRHSKVCTIKGLRDRRIRLSVPTAVQLYDLQDRLGLSQPSKVIDWLMEVTKHDIDKLPPLPIIPGSFPLFHQPYASIQGFGAPSSSLNPFLDSSLRKEGININSDHQSVEVDDQEQSLVAKLKYWDSNVVTRLKQKGVDHHHQDGVGDQSTHPSQISAQNFFPLVSSTNASMLPSSSLLSNNPMFNYWEPSSLSLTQFGGIGLQGAQCNPNHHQPSPLPAPASSASQLFLYPSMTTPSFVPPQNSFLSTSHHQQVDNDLRQLNRSHFLNLLSNSPHQASNNGPDFKSFPFGLNHQPHLHQNDHERHQNKGD